MIAIYTSDSLNTCTNTAKVRPERIGMLKKHVHFACKQKRFWWVGECLDELGAEANGKFAYVANTYYCVKMNFTFL